MYESEWDYKSAVDDFLRPRRQKDVVVVHASPPCTEFSVALTTRPRNLRAGAKNVKRALAIIGYADPTFWFLESPATGLLEDQPFVRKFAQHEHETCCCKRGFPCRKPTNIWSNLELELPMCNSSTPCRIKREFGRHLFTAQSGVSKPRTDLILG